MGFLTRQEAREQVGGARICWANSCVYAYLSTSLPKPHRRDGRRRRTGQMRKARRIYSQVSVTLLAIETESRRSQNEETDCNR